MPPWYALHVASNTERQVADRLAQGYIEAFYPHTVGQSRDKKRVTQQKLFPGYVFARFDWADRLPVIQCQQVIRILGWRPDCPVIIPDNEIEAVQFMTSQAAVAVHTHPFLAAGEPIIVLRGPLQGLQGFVVRTKGQDQARVVVSVTMLARSIAAEVDSADVELDRARAA